VFWDFWDKTRAQDTTSDLMTILSYRWEDEEDWPEPSSDALDAFFCDVDAFQAHLGDPYVLTLSLEGGAIAVWLEEGWRLEIERTNSGHKGYSFRCKGRPHLDLHVEDDWDGPGTFTPFKVEAFLAHLAATHT